MLIKFKTAKKHAQRDRSGNGEAVRTKGDYVNKPPNHVLILAKTKMIINRLRWRLE